MYVGLEGNSEPYVDGGLCQSDVNGGLCSNVNLGEDPFLFSV